MEKIKMKVPLVEMDGDEMTRILWRIIREDLIEPYVDLKTEYYDLSLRHRDETRDQVTVDAANATERLGVAVKCATITANRQRQEEYHLSEIWPSPNGTIRAVLDGTAFRAPILLPFLRPAVPGWEKPITVARHAYGDMYKAVELVTDEPGVATLNFKGQSGREQTLTIARTKGSAVFQGQHNTETSIRAFVHSCFQYALDTKQDLWFSAKDTISKEYDGEFRRAFDEEFANTYKDKFDTLGLHYFYTLIDDAVSRVMRSKGGFIWALKNYDGDVMSDMVAAAFGSLAMMTSVLMAPDGSMEFEASHGTVTRHFYRYRAGEKPSTNSTATIFAWTGALRRRGQLDDLPDLVSFAGKLESACLETMKDGLLTGDLAVLVDEGHRCQIVNYEESLRAISKRLAEKMRTVSER
ncbi:NADP-dependent isocitrate dehydrogenase [Oscillibacter valericigenes Sjm18-20]|nr:NADP-dependent isocitrate dehydrogenase [Oscillibacter valericigenes Sjm18-20]